MADKSRRVAQTEDLSNVEFETSEDVEVIPTFDNMGLRDELLRGIYAYGTSFIILFVNLTSVLDDLFCLDWIVGAHLETMWPRHPCCPVRHFILV